MIQQIPRIRATLRIFYPCKVLQTGSALLHWAAFGYPGDARRPRAMDEASPKTAATTRSKNAFSPYSPMNPIQIHDIMDH